MKSAPIILALVAICATGFAIPPQPLPNRTETVPSAEPIHITVDQLLLQAGRGNAFAKSPGPDAFKELNGKRVLIVGRMDMIRLGHDPMVETFVFNGYPKEKPDPANPKIQYHIFATMKTGTKTLVTSDPIEIEGRLMIRRIESNGKWWYNYRIEDASVEPTERPDGFEFPVLTYIGC